MNNFRIFCALLKRDLKLVISSFRTIAIDSISFSSCFILLFGYFLPTLGMSKTLSLPLFLGSLIIAITSLSFSRTVGIKSDIEFSGFINYHMTLPISKYWLIFEYIVAFSLELFFAITPALIVGLVILSEPVQILTNLIPFFLIYIISLLFYSIFFLFISFAFKWAFFISNTWERILTPMINLGCLVYTWYPLSKFSPLLSYITLLSPLTFISEGFRNSILDINQFLPLSICFAVIVGWIILFFILLIYFFKKTMDPV